VCDEQGSKRAGKVPRGKHQAIDRADILRAKEISGKCGHLNLRYASISQDDQRAVMRWPVDFHLLPATDRLKAGFRLLTTAVVVFFAGELDETKGDPANADITSKSCPIAGVSASGEFVTRVPR
jgi:hypothetical protein